MRRQHSWTGFKLVFRRTPARGLEEHQAVDRRIIVARGAFNGVASVGRSFAARRGRNEGWNVSMRLLHSSHALNLFHLVDRGINGHLREDDDILRGYGTSDRSPDTSGVPGIAGGARGFAAFNWVLTTGSSDDSLGGDIDNAANCCPSSARAGPESGSFI
jgi:hypothetical protein